MVPIPTVTSYSNDLLQGIESPATIVVYSRTHISMAVAEKVKKELEQSGIQTNILQINPKEDLTGVIGYGKLCWRAKSAAPSTELHPCEPIPAEVKSVIFCGPVHVWTLPDPLRSYLVANKEMLTSSERKFYAIATMGRNGEDSFVAATETILGRELSGGFAVVTSSCKAFCESVSEGKTEEVTEEKKEEEKKEENEEKKE